MNQRILLFIVIFLGFLIIVGTTVVITTVIERSRNVDFFENTTDTEFHSTCGTSGIEDVIKLEDQKILIKCFDGPVHIYDSKNCLLYTSPSPRD